LKTLAKLYGLKTSGTKAQLIEKLVKIGSTSSVAEKSVTTRKKKNTSHAHIKKQIKQEKEVIALMNILFSYGLFLTFYRHANDLKLVISMSIFPFILVMKKILIS
jgi:hypothetical protein